MSDREPYSLTVRVTEWRDDGNGGSTDEPTQIVDVTLKGTAPECAEQLRTIADRLDRKT